MEHYVLYISLLPVDFGTVTVIRSWNFHSRLFSRSLPFILRNFYHDAFLFIHDTIDIPLPFISIRGELHCSYRVVHTWLNILCLFFHSVCSLHYIHLFALPTDSPFLHHTTVPYHSHFVPLPVVTFSTVYRNGMMHSFTIPLPPFWSCVTIPRLELLPRRWLHSIHFYHSITWFILLHYIHYSSTFPVVVCSICSLEFYLHSTFGELFLLLQCYIFLFICSPTFSLPSVFFIVHISVPHILTPADRYHSHRFPDVPCRWIPHSVFYIYITTVYHAYYHTYIYYIPYLHIVQIPLRYRYVTSRSRVSYIRVSFPSYRYRFTVPTICSWNRPTVTTIPFLSFLLFAHWPTFCSVLGGALGIWMPFLLCLVTYRWYRPTVPRNTFYITYLPPTITFCSTLHSAIPVRAFYVRDFPFCFYRYHRSTVFPLRPCIGYSVTSWLLIRCILGVLHLLLFILLFHFTSHSCILPLFGDTALPQIRKFRHRPTAYLPPLFCLPPDHRRLPFTCLFILFQPLPHSVILHYHNSLRLHSYLHHTTVPTVWPFTVLYGVH